MGLVSEVKALGAVASPKTKASNEKFCVAKKT